MDKGKIAITRFHGYEAPLIIGLLIAGLVFLYGIFTADIIFLGIAIVIFTITGAAHRFYILPKEAPERAKDIGRAGLPSVLLLVGMFYPVFFVLLIGMGAITQDNAPQGLLFPVTWMAPAIVFLTAAFFLAKSRLRIEGKEDLALILKGVPNYASILFSRTYEMKGGMMLIEEKLGITKDGKIAEGDSMLLSMMSGSAIFFLVYLLALIFMLIIRM